MSDMVTKLLQKDPGLCYQSANDLSCDVNLIQNEHESSNSLSCNKIELARYDFSTKLLMPQNLAHDSLFNAIPPLKYVYQKMPKVMSDMVTKLLQKDPGLCYQSANGLSCDIDLI